MRLWIYVGKRLLRMVPSLLGITLVTFLLMDLAPSSRAELRAARGGMAETAGAADSEAGLQLLREHWGMVDPQTKEPYSIWRRYAQWLGRACTLDFAGPGEDADAFRGRLLDALPVTLLLNALALLLALGIAIPLGARLGMAAGGLLDRTASALMFLMLGVPEFLLATLLLLSLGGGWWAPVLPAGGLQSPGAASWPPWQQMLDMAAHLCLPVCALAVGPCVVVARFLRDSVARAAGSDFVQALRAWGTPERVVRRRALRAGMSPLVTLLGVLLPGLVGGSVVVESVFSLPGLGRLAFDAVMLQEYPMVMALTVLVSVVTLLSLLLSDLLHRAVDPRVELR
jgi:peptide/nickel transport system permease protein